MQKMGHNFKMVVAVLALCLVVMGSFVNEVKAVPAQPSDPKPTEPPPQAVEGSTKSNPDCIEPCTERCMLGGNRSPDSCDDACRAQCGTLHGPKNR